MIDMLLAKTTLRKWGIVLDVFYFNFTETYNRQDGTSSFYVSGKIVIDLTNIKI